MPTIYATHFDRRIGKSFEEGLLWGSKLRHQVLVFVVSSGAWSKENKPFPWKIAFKCVIKVVEEGSLVMPAFYARFFSIQIDFNFAAKDGFNEGSILCVALKLWILFWKMSNTRKLKYVLLTMRPDLLLTDQFERSSTATVICWRLVLIIVLFHWPYMFNHPFFL